MLEVSDAGSEASWASKRSQSSRGFLPDEDIAALQRGLQNIGMH